MRKRVVRERTVLVKNGYRRSKLLRNKEEKGKSVLIKRGLS